ncbi:hypothetical protein [Bacillus sp. ISL-57]|uniref:hypothetical protein n=1 Tax=Bacillus sp. ISL-57 TaxID=2819135 RepID=UPI001BECBDA1|nr:hypothetical protein [Bacillus sp. ISL-57]MBT2716597.1 hypothetical protein [Bacillus sp. ISL-57]
MKRKKSLLTLTILFFTISIILVLLSFIINIWDIKIEGNEIIKYFSISKSDIGDIVTIIFGISGGVLALIGLIAIFISINSQHKIQKCRELYWEIIKLSFEKSNPITLSNEMTNLLWQYSKISANDDEDFINKIIKGSQKTIIYVLIVWTSFIPFAIVNYLVMGALIIVIGYVGGVMVLIFFHNILGRLNNLTDIGMLKETKEILDIKTNNDFQSLLLLVDNIKLKRMQLVRENLKIALDLNVPIQGFKTTLTGIQYITWGSAHKTLEKQIKLKCEDVNQLKTSSRTIRMDMFGNTGMLDIKLGIDDFNEEISKWIHNGMFWAKDSDSEVFLDIHLIDDKWGRYNEEEQPGYEIITTEDKSGIESESVQAIVPPDTYAIRLSTYITLTESKDDRQYLDILWEFPIDLYVEPRIVAVSVGANGRVLSQNYWDYSQIKEDIENIEK